MDDITPKERVFRAINCEEVDKIPVIPQLTFATAKWRNISISEALVNHNMQLDALLYAQKTCNYDGIYAQWESPSVLIISAMGAPIIIFEDISPRLKDILVKKPEDLDLLSIPNPKIAGRIPMNLELIKNLSKNVGNDLAIISSIPGPFSFVCDLMGVDNALSALNNNSDFIEKIMEFVRIATITIGIAKIQAGAEILTISEPYVNFKNVSPKQFEDFCFPVIKKLIEEVRIKKTKIGLHICGNSLPIINLMAETGADYLELDSKVDLVTAHKNTKGEICLSGNIDITSLFIKPAIEIEKECQSLLNKVEKQGFILSSGCEIRYRTPIENICSMVKSTNL